MWSWQSAGEQNSVVLCSRSSGHPTLGNREQMLCWTIKIISPWLVEHKDFGSFFSENEGFNNFPQNSAHPDTWFFTEHWWIFLPLLGSCFWPDSGSSPSFHSILRWEKEAFIDISANILFIQLWGGAALGKGNVLGSHPLCSTASGRWKKGCFLICKQQPYVQEWRNAYST